MAGSAPDPFPWQRVMAIGFGLLHLSSEQFWAMTIREFEAAANGLFGDQDDRQPLVHSDLEDLMRRFPD